MRRVDLLGGTLVDGRAGVVAGRMELLLAVLVIRGARGARRDELVDILWPTGSGAVEGRGLSPLLSRLRRVVGPIDGRGLVRLSEPVAGDLADAERLLTAAREALEVEPERALELAGRAAAALGAPLLPAHDDPWTERQRAMLTGSGDDARALVAEAGLRVGSSALAPALRAAAQLVEDRPLREDAVALLMRVHQALGDTASALAAYEALRLRLGDQLGAHPGARLRAHHLSLLVGSSDGPAPGPPARTGAPLLPAALARERRRLIAGRTPELAAAARALAPRAAAGTPRLVVLEGPPGAGKSRLAAEVAAQRHGAGERVLFGRCLEGTTAPFGPLVEALRPLVLTLDPETLTRALGPLAGDLAALVPALHRRIGVPTVADAALDPISRRYRLFEAVAALLGAQEAPLLLVLDDVQWLDGSSVPLLAHLLAAEDLGTVAILATARTGAAGAGPVGLLRAAAGGGTTVSPRTLDLVAVREVVAAQRPDAPVAEQHELAERLLQRTGGSPLLVQASLITGVEVGAGEGLADAVRGALAWAGAEARAFVEVLAVDGGRAEIEVLADAADTTPAGAIARAGRAHEAGLLSPPPGPGAIGALHDTVRDATLVALGATERAAIHARLALAYERVHGPDDEAVVTEVARHWAGADGRRTTTRAAQYGERAARQALASLAYEQAADQARAAREQLETAEGDDARRLALLMLEGDAHNRASALVQAREALGAALVLAQRLGEDELVARIALDHGGHRLAAGILDPELVAAFEVGLAAASEDDVVRARLSGRLAGSLLTGPVDRRDALARDAVAGARASGDPQALAETLLSQHVGEVFRADPAARGALVDEAERLAQRHGLRELALHARMLRFSDLLEAGDLAAARGEVIVWSREAEDALVPYHRWAAAVCEPTLALLDGDLATARRQLARAERLAVPLGQDSVVVAAHSAHALVIGMWDGSAAAIATALRGMLAETGGVPVWEAATAFAETLAGEHDAARERVTRVVAGGLDGVVDANRLTLASFLTLAGVASGVEPPALEALHAVLAPHSGRWVVQHYGGAVHGPVDVRLSLLEAALGRPAQAAASLARADAALGASPPLMLSLDRDHAEARTLQARGDDADAAAIVEVVGAQAAAAGLPGWTALLSAAPVTADAPRL